MSKTLKIALIALSMPILLGIFIWIASQKDNPSGSYLMDHETDTLEIIRIVSDFAWGEAWYQNGGMEIKKNWVLESCGYECNKRAESIKLAKYFDIYDISAVQVEASCTVFYMKSSVQGYAYAEYCPNGIPLDKIHKDTVVKKGKWLLSTIEKNWR